LSCPQTKQQQIEPAFRKTNLSLSQEQEQEQSFFDPSFAGRRERRR